MGVPGPLLAGPSPVEFRSQRRMTWLRRFAYAIAAPVAVGLIRLLWSTYRFSVYGEERVRELLAKEPLILTLWHDRVFVCAWYMGRLGRLGARVTYLVSPSIDGELAVRLLALIGARSVRGSATRSGVKAMRGLYRAIVREQGSPVVLPDGPQGPRHHCKPGSLLLAQLSGAKVLPMACGASRAWSLNTWDRLLIPWPFARVVLVLGTPATVAKGLDEEEFEGRRAELDRTLKELVAEATGLAMGEENSGE